MRIFRPAISDHRLARVSTWARLWLLRLAAFALSCCEADGAVERSIGALVRPHLLFLRKTIVALFIVRAARQAHLRIVDRPACARPSSARLRPVRGGRARYIIGARLRRALKARGVRAEIAALLNALCNADAHVAAMAARFARRRTRLNRIAPCFDPRALIASAPTPTPVVTDSS